MLSNILPTIALAGAAMAACPLTVDIVSTDAHVATVAVTNIGSDAITVFKGNTVLSEHATMDLLVSDAAGNALPFEGVFVNYKKTNVPATAFQTIQPGETVTAEVNAAKTYKLAGVASAQISALQGFRYVVGETIPTALKGLEGCEAESETVAIVPDQSKIAEEYVSKRGEANFGRISKRAVTYSGCTTAQTTSLTTSFADAVSMSSAAYTAAATYADNFSLWFRTATTSQATKVRTIYNDVAGVQTTSPKVYCNDQYSYCTDGTALLYTVPSANSIVPCPSNGFWDFPQLSPTCSNDDYDMAGSILHESTHLYGTGDYAYGYVAAQKLSAAQAAANADTYEMYGESVRLGGCTVG
ncbi:hypothetical protein BJ878DRAFT_47137 [Calycina marina]|uniref:deuterolysin n=1 Tax=Calycina marina TaxID=1763456 RepID=A0A9P8CF84_9HELO|nr:hypothetical protein BJ878DRAFT_47137 [Calycina marina]